MNMKTVSIISLIVSIVALTLVMAGRSSSMSEAEVNAIVDARLKQREREFVSNYGQKITQIEKDLGLAPSNPETLEDLGKSLARMIFMPNTARGSLNQKPNAP
jgi:hypothetical protein